MTRTVLKNRILPDYTKGEEIFNMVSHIIGGFLGIVALVICVLKSSLKGDVYGVVSSAVYGFSLVSLYSMSSVYHGLKTLMSKKVFQVLDHCTIYLLIGGTYTPVALVGLRKSSVVWGWLIFALIWLMAILATVFTAIDLKKYSKFSMFCYITMGWCIIVSVKSLVSAISINGFLWLLAGGVSYTLGAVLYGVGSKKRYMHSAFHIFVVLGSLLQLISIYRYVL